MESITKRRCDVSKVFFECLSWLCEEVLDVLIIEDDRDSNISVASDRLCDDCTKELSKKAPPKFTPKPYGETTVTKDENFDDMMAKRKIENRKKSGKGPPRGGR